MDDHKVLWGEENAEVPRFDRASTSLAVIKEQRPAPLVDPGTVYESSGFVSERLQRLVGITRACKGWPRAIQVLDCQTSTYLGRVIRKRVHDGLRLLRRPCIILLKFRDDPRSGRRAKVQISVVPFSLPLQDCESWPRDELLVLMKGVHCFVWSRRRVVGQLKTVGCEMMNG